MSQRLNYFQVSEVLSKKYLDFSMALKKTPVVQELGSLVDIRASQINGCGFCLDMHVKEATIKGERALRLHHVAIWRESPLSRRVNAPRWNGPRRLRRCRRTACRTRSTTPCGRSSRNPNCRT